MTMVVTLWEAVVGKCLAAWTFAGLALALTFPMWITVNYLGNPDNGTILAAYIGSLLLAGGYLAIGSRVAPPTNNHGNALILPGGACFLAVCARGLPGSDRLPPCGPPC